MMINRLDGWDKRHFRGQVPTSVGIAVKTGKIAAGNFQTNAMPRFEDITGSPQVNGVGIHLARLNQLGPGGGGLTVPRGRPCFQGPMTRC